MPGAISQRAARTRRNGNPDLGCNLKLTNCRLQPNNTLALKNRGFAAVPYDRLICNDDSGAGFDGVVDLVSKLRINAEALSQLLGRNTAATVRHRHPSSASAARSERALPVGCAFEKRVDM